MDSLSSVDCEALGSRCSMKFPMDIKDRICYLKSLLCFIQEKELKIINTVSCDLGRPKHEIIMSEISCVKYEIKNLIKRLKRWLKPVKVGKSCRFRKDKCHTEYQPLGTVLVIGSWSSPFQSIMIPLAGAIAAGNCVIIKPNELAPETRKLLADQIPKYLDRRICQVLWCSLDQIRVFLDANKMDFIFFSGVSSDGAFVMSEAAKTVTPVCLDLSGKCPVYIDKCSDVELAARRIMWGKIYNCGQSSLAPDYALCHEDVLGKFVEACKCALVKFFNEIPNLDNEDYGRIVSQGHTQRLKELICESQGVIEFGSGTNVLQRFVQPTLITNVTECDVLMQHEIYGPILPVITVRSSEDALSIVRSLPKPQAVYIFTKDKKVFDYWKRTTHSGGIVLNDVAMFKGLNGMDFGGVEFSGMGQHRGKASIDLFSHKRGVIERSTKDKLDKKMRYPPYYENTTRQMRKVFHDRRQSNR